MQPLNAGTTTLTSGGALVFGGQSLREEDDETTHATNGTGGGATNGTGGGGANNGGGGANGSSPHPMLGQLKLPATPSDALGSGGSGKTSRAYDLAPGAVLWEKPTTPEATLGGLRAKP